MQFTFQLTKKTLHTPTPTKEALTKMPSFASAHAHGGLIISFIFFSIFLVSVHEANEITVDPMEESRRKLGSFQICALCTCCGGAKGLCLPSPCCYAINCNIPNRPFGLCTLSPKTCNCLECQV